MSNPITPEPDLPAVVAAYDRWEIGAHESGHGWVATTRPTPASERVIAAHTVPELAAKLAAVTCRNCRELIAPCPPGPHWCSGLRRVHEATGRHECRGDARPVRFAEPVRP